MNHSASLVKPTSLSTADEPNSLVKYKVIWLDVQIFNGKIFQSSTDTNISIEDHKNTKYYLKV